MQNLSKTDNSQKNLNVLLVGTNYQPHQYRDETKTFFELNTQKLMTRTKRRHFRLFIQLFLYSPIHILSSCILFLSRRHGNASNLYCLSIICAVCILCNFVNLLKNCLFCNSFHIYPYTIMCVFLVNNDDRLA